MVNAIPQTIAPVILDTLEIDVKQVLATVKTQQTPQSALAKGNVFPLIDAYV